VNALIPKAGNILLDTNCAIELIADVDVAEAFYAMGRAFISSISVGELSFGAYNSMHAERNLSNIRALLAEIPVLDCDAESADWYGRIRHQLKRSGKPIPDNDIWIASVALQYGLKLATKDRHFSHIEGLECIVW
jgi:tRNA(fMet)-specific endonuclease VapC